MTTPVEGFALRTSDAQEAEAALNAIFPGVQLRAPQESFEFSIRSAAVAHATWTDHTLPIAGATTMDEPGPVIVLQLHGRIRLEHAGAAHTEGPALMDAPGPASATWQTARSKGFALDREYVRSVATRLSGRNQPAHLFHAGRPQGPAEARTWKAAADFAAQSLTRHADAMATPTLQRSLVHHLVLTLLHTFPNVALDDVQRGTDRVLPAAVRRAVAFIDEHAHEPVTVDDVAAAAHVSSRGLQAAFRRSLGVTPGQVLRRARLDGARRDLLDADPEVVTVAAVAHRWGYLHLGNFAAVYRDAFGELPSRTLRR
ncbi:helix-turn-helix transcriptional regulator [Isoptericola sp. NPDC057191]|uniref:helix-turn-helix transcriptional regulator n=1 Tax=Isoptericola sp. NPDC057191 TaxID=3346041 RepID=UPI0036384DA8